MASGDFRYLLTVFREMSNSLAISRTPCPAPFNSYISFTSATFSNAPVHLRENYADDDTCFRWVNPNLLLLPSLELLVTPQKAAPGGRVMVLGEGGYLFTPPGRYDESSRTFEVFFGGGGRLD